MLAPWIHGDKPAPGCQLALPVASDVKTCPATAPKGILNPDMTSKLPVPLILKASLLLFVPVGTAANINSVPLFDPVTFSAAFA